MGRSCAGRTKEGVPKRNNSGSAARQEQHLCTREQDRSGPRQPQLERDQLRLGAAAAASRRLLPRCRCRHHRRCAYHRTAAAAADAGWEPAAPPRRPQLPPATPCPCRQGHTPPRVAVATPPTAQVWARGARARWARRRWPWRHQAPASLPPPPPPPAPGTPGSRSTPPHRALPPAPAPLQHTCDAPRGAGSPPPPSRPKEERERGKERGVGRQARVSVASPAKITAATAAHARWGSIGYNRAREATGAAADGWCTPARLGADGNEAREAGTEGR